MLPNWTDGLQTFGKWLEYFQMAEMHWLLFPCKKKKNWGSECDLDPLLSPSEFCVHHIAVEAMCLRFTFVSQTHIFFLSKWDPGTQKGNSISQPAVSLHSQPTTAWSLPALWSFSPKSATAVAAMWEFVTAGCVWLGIFFRLWHSWCDVCFILGRWCGELSV